jgi:hypothetical protein
MKRGWIRLCFTSFGLACHRIFNSYNAFHTNKFLLAILVFRLALHHWYWKEFKPLLVLVFFFFFFFHLFYHPLDFPFICVLAGCMIM